MVLKTTIYTEFTLYDLERHCAAVSVTPGWISFDSRTRNWWRRMKLSAWQCKHKQCDFSGLQKNLGYCCWLLRWNH